MKKMTDKKRKVIASVCIGAVILFMAAMTYFIGKPMIRFVSEPEKFRAWVNQYGVWGRLAFLGMTMLQVIVAFIPGEPMELVAGYAFGSVEGTLLCIIGATLGGIPVFFLVRKFGVKAVEIFFSKEKIDSLKFLRDSEAFRRDSGRRSGKRGGSAGAGRGESARRGGFSKRDFWVFILFMIPGTPKDLLNYFVGLTDMKFLKWLLISLVARIPSIVTSTVGADALGMKKYTFAVIVFAVTLVISGVGILTYRLICKAHEDARADGDVDN